MLYVDSVSDEKYCVIDTYDNKKYFYTISELTDLASRQKISGFDKKTSNVDCNSMRKTYITLPMIEDFDSEKSLSFETVSKSEFTKLLLMTKSNYDDIIIIEDENSIKIISDCIISFRYIADIEKDWGFFAFTKFTSIDLHHINTSDLDCMSYMFHWCKAEVIDVSSFDTSSVTNMVHMFSSFKGKIIGLDNFDTSSVVNMAHMFDSCRTELTGLDKWNTSKVKNMSYMFNWCKANILDVSSFDTSSVTDMQYMFCACRAKITGLDRWDTSSVTNMLHMFAYYEDGVLDLSSFKVREDASYCTMLYSFKSRLKTKDKRISQLYRLQLRDRAIDKIIKFLKA